MQCFGLWGLQAYLEHGILWYYPCWSTLWFAKPLKIGFIRVITASGMCKCSSWLCGSILPFDIWYLHSPPSHLTQRHCWGLSFVFPLGLGSYYLKNILSCLYSSSLFLFCSKITMTHKNNTFTVIKPHLTSTRSNIHQTYSTMTGEKIFLNKQEENCFNT